MSAEMSEWASNHKPEASEFGNGMRRAGKRLEVEAAECRMQVGGRRGGGGGEEEVEEEEGGGGDADADADADADDERRIGSPEVMRHGRDARTGAYKISTHLPSLTPKEG